jgi:hypothetical protein
MEVNTEVELGMKAKIMPGKEVRKVAKAGKLSGQQEEEAGQHGGGGH